MEEKKSEYYVYVYIDPRNFEEFYYGKGKGNRKESHLLDESDSEKAKRIKEILKQNLKPIIRVIVRDLTENEAFLVEKTLIWKLGRNLTNISSGHFAEKFRPHNTFQRELQGFDFENDIYYINVGEGEHRCWEDCKNYRFLAAGHGKNWSDQIKSLKIGDIVVPYLKEQGYVGIGIVTNNAVKVSDFGFMGFSLERYKSKLKNPHILDNSEDENLAEYLVEVQWIETVNKENAKWTKNSNLFTTQLVKASLKSQPTTLDYLENEFNIKFSELFSEG